MNQCKKINTSEIHLKYLSDIVIKQARMNAVYTNTVFELLVIHHQMVHFNEININQRFSAFQNFGLFVWSVYINTITAIEY